MLTGKVALITGASRGIGRQIALTLAQNGATVVINYNGSAQKAEETAEEIRNAGGTAVTYQCDVSDFSQSEKMVQDVIAQHKKVDILVNNAGITRDGLLMRMSESDYDAVLNTNLKGAFNMTRHLSKYFLKQRSGKIINITSVSGVTGNAGQANYAAAKAGMIGLTKSVARELASRGIRVNAVAPGFIQTEMTEKLSETVQETIKKTIPLGRMGTTQDVADMVLFLVGEHSNYITGQVFHVDGGMVM